jgi:hypothetical protein
MRYVKRNGLSSFYAVPWLDGGRGCCVLPRSSLKPRHAESAIVNGLLDLPHETAK